MNFFREPFFQIPGSELIVGLLTVRYNYSNVEIKNFNYIKGTDDHKNELNENYPR